MKRRIPFGRMQILALAALLLVWLEQPVAAYVDPGAASYFFQFLIGGVLAGVYVLRMYWTRMKESIVERFSRSRTSR